MTTTITRTDVHRPSAPEFDPEAYELRGVFDLRPDYPAPAMTEHRLAVVNALIEQGYRFGGSSAGVCGHCGQGNVRYAALLARADVREMIYVGETCLDNRFALTKGEFDALRKAASLNRERMAKRDRIAALVDAHPLLAWLTYNVADWSDGSSFGFLVDVAYRFNRDGELSDRQIEAIEAAIGRETERRDARIAREAAKAEIVASGVKAPEGRVVVTGEVVSVKDREGYMPGTTEWKMTVRTDAGWVAWATVPEAFWSAAWAAPDGRSFDEWLRGRRVTFTATLKRSESDPLFAFAKRPTKAALVDQEVAA